MTSIEITVTFTELNDEAKNDLKDYVRHDKLTVSAVAKGNESTNSAEVKQYGQRLGIEGFRSYFEKDKCRGSAKELQDVVSKLRESHDGLAGAKTKPAIEQALHDYEAAHPEKCALIPSEDQFYRVSHGANLLQKQIQWVYVPARSGGAHGAVRPDHNPPILA